MAPEIMTRGRHVWTSLGIIAHLLISCSSYDNGGIVEECAANEVMFGCKDEGDIIVIKDAWIHQRHYRVPANSCHIPEYNIQFRVDSLLRYINKKCVSSNLCKFNLFNDVPGAEMKTKWKEGVIQVEYECILDSSINSICGVTLEEQEGWIRNIGYPNYYLGPAACTFSIHVDKGQHIALNIVDINLKEIIRPMENECADVLTVTEGQKLLFSECGTLRQPAKVISEGNYLNISLHSGSEIFLNRGFVIYFKAMGCRTPGDPEGGSLSYRNAEVAEFQCSDERIFPDTFQKRKVLKCIRWFEWDRDLPNCYYLDELLKSGNITKFEYRKYNGSREESVQKDEHLISVFITPSLIIAFLLTGNLIIVAIIRRYKHLKRCEQIEEVKYACNVAVSNPI